MKPRVTGICAALALATLLIGCGYQHESLFPKDIATVHVPIMGNKTFYQGVEFDLTEALIKEIELRTPYKVVSSESADTVLEGQITNVAQNELSRTSDGGLGQEIEVRVVVNLKWRDRRTGQVLRERSGLADVGRYKPAEPVGEPFAVAQHEAVQRLATRIVSVMREDF